MQAGAWIRHGSLQALTPNAIKASGILTLGGDLLAGSLFVGGVLAAAAGGWTYAARRKSDRREGGFVDLVHGAADRYIGTSITAWEFARGKLRHDPVYRVTLSAGLLRSGERSRHRMRQLALALLAEAGRAFDAGLWPAGWSPPPRFDRMAGVERRSVAALARGALAGDAEIIEADARRVPFDRARSHPAVRRAAPDASRRTGRVARRDGRAAGAGRRGARAGSRRVRGMAIDRGAPRQPPQGDRGRVVAAGVSGERRPSGARASARNGFTAEVRPMGSDAFCDMLFRLTAAERRVCTQLPTFTSCLRARPSGPKIPPNHRPHASAPSTGAGRQQKRMSDQKTPVRRPVRLPSCGKRARAPGENCGPCPSDRDVFESADSGWSAPPASGRVARRGCRCARRGAQSACDRTCSTRRAIPSALRRRLVRLRPDARIERHAEEDTFRQKNPIAALRQPRGVPHRPASYPPSAIPPTAKIASSHGSAIATSGTVTRAGTTGHPMRMRAPERTSSATWLSAPAAAAAQSVLYRARRQPTDERRSHTRRRQPQRRRACRFRARAGRCPSRGRQHGIDVRRQGAEMAATPTPRPGRSPRSRSATTARPATACERIHQREGATSAEPRVRLWRDRSRNTSQPESILRREAT